MKTMIWFAVVAAALIIQSTLLPLIAIHGIYPDLLLIVVISSALLSGTDKGVGMGFLAGLLQDLATGSIFGINTLAKVAVGYSVGLAEQKVFKEHILLPIAATAAATSLQGVLDMAIMLILGYKIQVMTALASSVLPVMAYNMVLAVPVHFLVYRLTAFTAE